MPWVFFLRTSASRMAILWASWMGSGISSRVSLVA